MATSGRNGTLDPFKTFDISLEERKAAEERAKMRGQLKNEWQKKMTNPHRAVGDYVFDPALQRFNSMRVSQYDYFKATPKTTAWGFALLIVPMVGLGWLVLDSKIKEEKRFRNGEVMYKDRSFKFI
ncbi:uncharacterized protein LOC135461378 [Liolophura sinensis]|uniref:uncharacterized protein LOC135461378 n=1 Tax=Liolophura sinensis TaxID=3198878 RepID=UPI003158AE66